MAYRKTSAFNFADKSLLTDEDQPTAAQRKTSTISFADKSVINRDDQQSAAQRKTSTISFANRSVITRDDQQSMINRKTSAISFAKSYTTTFREDLQSTLTGPVDGTLMSCYTEKSSLAEDSSPLIYAIDSIRNYFYNPRSGRVLGRTPIDVVRIFVFYLCFYGLLAALFATCFATFTYGVLNDDQPLLTGEHSLLNLHPVLSIRPIPDWRTTLIRFEMGKEQSFQLYTQNIQAYIDQYENFAQLSHPDVRQTECDIYSGVRADSDLKAVCKFDLKELKECNKESLYGYARGQPCVILKINKMYGWLPDPDMMHNATTDKNILVKCYGVEKSDAEFLNHVRYFPSKTINGVEYGFFSHVFYPYLVQAGYLPPVVMTQFTNMTKNRLIMVECRLFGIKNMVYDPIRRLGSTRFEIIMD